MSNFVKALESKIKVLQEERAEHEEAIEAIDAKLELLNELHAEEGGEPVAEAPPAPKKRKPGRPKGSKNKKTPAKKADPKKGASGHGVDDDLYQEAVRQLANLEEGGTSKELQERMVKRFNPQPRPQRTLGPGITAGTKKDVEKAQASRKIDHSISIDEGE